MSEWNDIEDSDIEINFKTKEVEILAGDNHFGAIYAVLTFDRIKKICERIQDVKNHEGR